MEQLKYKEEIDKLIELGSEYLIDKYLELYDYCLSSYPDIGKDRLVVAYECLNQMKNLYAEYPRVNVD